MKLYTLNEQFIEEVVYLPDNFIGIIHLEFGSKEWYKNGKFHRIDGPAIEWPNGYKEWHIHGKKCTQEQHALFISIMKFKGLTK